VPFGPGGVQYYRYEFDRSQTHTWDGTEPAWSGGTLQVSGDAPGNDYYLHLKGFNSVDVPNGTLDLGPFYFSPTPPTGLRVYDSGDYTMSTNQLTARLEGANDPEEGIGGYQVAVGTTAGGTDVTDGWLDVEMDTNPVISGVNLAVGSKYWISGQARNTAGIWSSTATADGITVIAPVGSIADALALSPGTVVGLKGKPVVAASGAEAAIEEYNRFAAIHVSGSGFQPGKLADLIGTMGAAAAPRVLNLLSIEAQYDGEMPSPVYMRLADLGGFALGPFTPGVDYGTGLYNLSLLVKVCGVVTGAGDDYFIIEDGSVVDFGTGMGGVKVLCGSLHKPASGTFVAVTGISTVEPGTSVKAVKPRLEADIVP
jgi:hypothetical protein